MITLTHFISNDCVLFSVEDNGKKIPVDQWSALENCGCLLLTSWKDNLDDVRASEYEVSVDISVISDVSDDIAKDLCLPKYADFVMHIKHEGLITRPDFKFSYEWQKDCRGRPIAGAKRVGCFLKVGSTYSRLPHDIYVITECIDKIKSILPDDIQGKLLEWHKIENHLPDETSRSITIDNFLSSTKVYLAAAFELTIQQTPEGIDFDPLLLSAKKSEDAEYDDNDIEFEKLLAPIDHEKFVSLFKNNNECRPNFTLGSGKYLILSNQLHQSLKIVHELKNSSIENKLEFLKNPRAVFSERGIDDTTLDKIYSDRIEGLGDPRTKVIPWIKIEGQDWFPSENSPRGLQIRDDRIELDQSECLALENKLEYAIQNNLPSFEYKGVSIYATDFEETKKSIAIISPSKPSIKKENSNTVTQPKANVKKYVLYVKDNFSDVKYQIKSEPRTEILSFTSTPKMLKTSLKPHQVDALKWLIESYRAGVGGVLLADDMGLGKTLQSLTFLGWVRENIRQSIIPSLPILIVAPTGLLNNWTEEHNKHLHHPGLGFPVLAYGTELNKLREKKNSSALVKSLNVQKLKEADWILTTYETLSNYQTSFAAVHYSAVIFDEMQKIKTPNTRITEAAQTINSDFIVGMTGTPIETRLSDLWCLIDTLQPGRLGTIKEFSAKYEKSGASTSDLKDELTKSISSAPPLMLRRMKNDVLDGLPKITPHYCEELMPKNQADVYKKIIDDAKLSSDDGRQLESLHRLRSVSLHPNKYNSDIIHESFISESARLRATFKILDDIYKKREKVLIFIEFREWHKADFLPAILKRRYHLINTPMVISGAIKSAERQVYVNKFQEENDQFDVMLVSPRAGGVGLTLTRANHVIHLSRWWNPAVEDQCTDRVYRMGQKKDVHVYFPMARHPEFGENSFDYCLKKLLDNRRHMSRSLLTPPVSKDDLNQLKKSAISNASGSQNAKHAANNNYSIHDINCMEPRQFEDYVASECGLAGLIVRKTPITGDGGADLVIESMSGEIIALIQCKHTQQKEAGYEAINDLLRAKDNYNAKKSKLIAVSNASGFNASSRNSAQLSNQIILIDAVDILNVGEIIKEQLFLECE